MSIFDRIVGIVRPVFGSIVRCLSPRSSGVESRRGFMKAFALAVVAPSAIVGFTLEDVAEDVADAVADLDARLCALFVKVIQWYEDHAFISGGTIERSPEEREMLRLEYAGSNGW